MSKMKYIKKGICPTCLQPLKLTIIPFCRGAFKETFVIFTDLPCLACGSLDHNRWYPNQEFGEMFNEVVFESGQLPIAKSGFFTFKILKYFNCGEKFSRQSGSLDTVSGNLSFEGIPSFSIAIIAPVVWCEHCSKNQIYASPDVSSNILDAIIAPFNSENIKPQFVFSVSHQTTLKR